MNGAGRQLLGTMLLSFIKAVTTTTLSSTETNNSFLDSHTYNNLMQNWSEAMKYQIDKVSNYIDLDDQEPVENFVQDDNIAELKDDIPELEDDIPQINN